MSAESDQLWQKALKDGDKLTDEFVRKLERVATTLSGGNREHIFYSRPVEVKKPKGDLVRLDKVIEASHLFAAQIILQVLPNVIRQLLKNMESSLVNHAGTWVARKALGEVVGSNALTGFFAQLVSFLNSTEGQQAIEDRIRDESAVLRESLGNECLSQKSKRGRVRVVSSRHPRKAKGAK